MNLDRIKAIQHLRFMKINRKRFSPDVVNIGFRKPNKLGYHFGIIALLPSVFPNELALDGNFVYMIREPAVLIKDEMRQCQILKKFFDLSYADIRHLFYPGNQNSSKPYFIADLSDTSTLEECLDNIEAFVNYNATATII